MKRHFSPKFWENLIQKGEQEKVPLNKVLLKLGLSKTTYYRKRKAFYQGTLHLNKEPGRPQLYQPQAHREEIERIIKRLSPFVSYRKIWQKLKSPKPSLATLYRMIKKLEVKLPSKEEKEEKMAQFIEEISSFLKEELKTKKEGSS